MAGIRDMICDAETKKTPAFQKSVRHTVFPLLFSPVSRCVPSEEDGWHPYTPNRFWNDVSDL